jgi:alpha-1,2-glucosyltransferase
MPTMMQTLALPAALVATVNLSTAWYMVVSREVTEPYLVSAYQRSIPDTNLMSNQDEFFHVPQAQRYCRGDYTWDPKITTPPGL